MKKSFAGILWQRVKNLAGAVWIKARSIVMRLFLLNRLLSKKEKTVFWSTVLILVVMLAIKSISYYRSLTIEVPKVGGVYSEGLVGQPEYLNPVLASSDNDKTVNSLIYQSLITLDNKNQVSPSLAGSFEVSADQKSYTFHLRDGVFWQDGTPFTSADVVYTFGLIQKPEEKSPYYNDFKDVLVGSPDQKTVNFSLKTPYGPFITNLNVGIIPSGKSLSDLNSHPVGTGPYNYINSTTKGNKVQKIILERNVDYWGDKPYLKKIQFCYYDSANQAEDMLEQEEISAVAGDSRRVNIQKISYPTSANINLIFNLRNTPFNNDALRQAIKAGTKNDTEVGFDLTVSDNVSLVKDADAFKEKMAPLNYKVNVKVVKENDLKDIISKKDFQALVVGIDFGHDFDPYSLWHSSQIASGINLAGFSDKGADILLEDARLLADPVARQAKYDEFYKLLDSKAVQIVLEQKQYTLSIDNKFKNVTITNALTPAEHLKDISNWYLETKRVKK